MKKRIIFLTVLFVMIVFFLITSNVSALSTTEGFTYGKKIVLKGATYCNAELLPSLKTCYDGDSIGFSLKKSTYTKVVIGGSNYGKRLVKYYYRDVNMPRIYVAYMKYDDMNIKVRVNGTGNYYCHANLGFNWETSNTKIAEGFPRWYHQTAYSPYVNILVKPRENNNAPIIKKAYTKVNGYVHNGSIYNNTSGISLAAEIKDDDNDYIDAKAGEVFVNGEKIFDSIKYKKFKSIFGEEKSRGVYSNPVRGIWSMKWFASDSEKSTSLNFTQEVKNRAPVIISANAIPKHIKNGDDMSLMAIAVDPDGDNIKFLRFYIIDEAGKKVYPFTSKYKTIEKNYSSGKQVTIKLNSNNIGIEQGRYTAVFVAIDGYNGSTKSKEARCSFDVGKNDEKEGRIVELYTTVNDIRTNCPLYNNTENIKFEALFKGNCKEIRSGPISVNDIERFGIISHGRLNTCNGITKSRGYYQRPDRGKWEIKWQLKTNKNNITKIYSRIVENRKPYIVSAMPIPKVLKSGDPLSFVVHPFDLDGDMIANVRIDITNSLGEIVKSNITGRKNISNSSEEIITIMTNHFKEGYYTAHIKARDSFDYMYGKERKVMFKIGAKEEDNNNSYIPGEEDNNKEEHGGNGHIISAWVDHTKKWEEHRCEFNKYYKKSTNGNLTMKQYLADIRPRGRGKNVFWSGEKFVLRAETIPQVKRVKVIIENTTFTTELHKINGIWNGTISNRKMENLWGQAYPEKIKFKFIAYGKKIIKKKVSI